MRTNEYPHPNLANASFDLPTRGRLVFANSLPQVLPPPCGEVEGDNSRLRVGVITNDNYRICREFSQFLAPNTYKYWRIQN